MEDRRLHPTEIEGLLSGWPEDVRDLARAARDLVLEIAPALSEKIAFGALGYVKAGVPYGVIGGNVCLVDVKRGRLRLAFLHGAFLPDPEGLLEGTAKAKREVPLADLEDLRRPAIAALIRAAVAYDPVAGEPSA